MPDRVRALLEPFHAKLADQALSSLAARPSPLDIACELCRAMDEARIRKRGKTYVQTLYDVLLAPADLARFEDRTQELVATLKDTLLWWAREHGYQQPADIRVRVTADGSLPAGRVGIEAGMRTEEAQKLGVRHST